MQKSDIKDVVTKGFTTKWWRDHRAGACKGCGVAKAMDKLTQRNVPPTGLPTKTKPEYAADLIPIYTDLLSAFTKASGKCGKAQAETKEALVLYRKQTNKALDMAEKMAREWDKDKGQGAVNAAKALSEINNAAGVVEKNLAPIPKATSEGDKALKSLVANYISSQHKEGPDQFEKFLAGVNSVPNSIKLRVHSKNLVEGDKSFKKILNAFKGVDKQKADPKQHGATAKRLQNLNKQIQSVTKMVHTTINLHKASVEDLHASRPEGV